MVQMHVLSDMIDYRGPEAVQIQISAEGVIWVNIDGECKLRVQKYKHLEIDDQRKGIP